MNFKKTFIQIICFSLIINFASLYAPRGGQPTPKKPIVKVAPSTIVTSPTTPSALINLTTGQTLTSFMYQPQFSSPTNETLTVDLSLSATNLSKINAVLTTGISVTINISLLATGNNNFQATVQALNSTTNTMVCSQIFTRLYTTKGLDILIVKPNESIPKTGQILYELPASTSWITGLIGGYIKKTLPTNPNLTEYVQSFTIKTNT